MKKIFIASIVTAIFIAACYKPPEPVVYLNGTDSSYLSVVQKYVRQHPNVASYDSVDFDKYRISKQQKCWYFRLPFKNKLLSTDFILLQTDSLGAVGDGRIVHLEKTASPLPPPTEGARGQTSITFNGSIQISSLDQKTVIQSNITAGYIESFHPGLRAPSNSPNRVRTGNPSNRGEKDQKAESFPVPYDELPEVVVVGYTQTADGGLTWSDYMMLQSMFASTGGGGGGSSSGGGGGGSSAGGDGYAVYNSIDGSGSSDGNAGPYATGTNSPTTPPHQDPNVTLSYDESYSRPAIDLNAWMKCFTDIPDADAHSTITLYGDLPVDGDPSVGLNLWNGNTGHCFLQLSKTNGAQSVTQIIGFTAQSAGKAIINADAFVPSKLVDNAGHKYNCSITMPLSAAGLSMVIATIQNQGDMPYSIVNYDCLDFALDVFNSVRGQDPLKISKKWDPSDPFSNIATGPKLYNLLSNMVDSHSPEAPNILISGSRWIGVSHGACN